MGRCLPPRAPAYAPLSGYDPGERLRRKLADHIVRKAGLWPGDRAICAPCGAGLAAVALARAFHRIRVAAVDPSEAALTRTAENAEAEGARGRIDLVRADPAALPFKEEVFQVAASPLALAGLEEPGEALFELHRVTGFYGKLFLAEPDFSRLPRAPRGVPRHAVDEELAEEMRGMGFGKIQRMKLDLLPGGGVLEFVSAKRFDPEEDEEEGGEGEGRGKGEEEGGDDEEDEDEDDDGEDEEDGEGEDEDGEEEDGEDEDDDEDDEEVEAPPRRAKGTKRGRA